MRASGLVVVLRLRSRDIYAFAAKQLENVWAPVASILRTESQDYKHPSRERSRRTTNLRAESQDYKHPSCERSRRTTNIHPASGVAGLQTCERSRRTTNIHSANGVAGLQTCERSRRPTNIHPANGVAGLQTCERSRRTTSIGDAAKPDALVATGPDESCRWPGTGKARGARCLTAPYGPRLTSNSRCESGWA